MQSTMAVRQSIDQLYKDALYYHFLKQGVSKKQAKYLATYSLKTTHFV